MLINLKYGVSQVVRGKVNVVSGLVYFIIIRCDHLKISTGKKQEWFPLLAEVYCIVRTEKKNYDSLLEKGTD